MDVFETHNIYIYIHDDLYIAKHTHRVSNKQTAARSNTKQQHSQMHVQLLIQKGYDFPTYNFKMI
jgi:hypothetical protein